MVLPNSSPFRLLILAIILLGAAVGCIKVRLPEPVAALQTGAASRYLTFSEPPLVLLVRNSEPEHGEIIGYQFILGAIPLTRIAPPRSANALAEEMLLRHLIRAGYSVAVVPERSAAEGQSALCPQATLVVTAPKLSVNAYDALFFRVVSVSGEIDIRQLDREGNEIKRSSLPFQSTSYRRYAFLPLLAYELEDAMRQALASLDLSQRSRVPRNAAPHSGERFFEVRVPGVSPAAVESLKGDLVETSEPELAGYVSRLLSQGIVSALDETGISFAQVTDDRRPSLRCPGAAQTEQVRLSVDEWEKTDRGTRVSSGIALSSTSGAGFAYKCRVNFSAEEDEELTPKMMIAEAAKRTMSGALDTPAVSGSRCDVSEEIPVCCENSSPLSSSV